MLQGAEGSDDGSAESGCCAAAGEHRGVLDVHHRGDRSMDRVWVRPCHVSGAGSADEMIQAAHHGYPLW